MVVTSSLSGNQFFCLSVIARRALPDVAISI